jgi:hypothetical protein
MGEKVFGVNSVRRKPGPVPAQEGTLLIWEHEWHCVFHGLVHGVPPRNEEVDDWELKRPPKLSNIDELDQERLGEYRGMIQRSGGWARRVRPVRTTGMAPEPKVWRQILIARTPNQVRLAYRASSFWLNPQACQRPWVKDLEEHAPEFLTAKSYRYPASDRPSSTEKRVLHFARAMAGIEIRISPVRAIDRIRTMKHGDECPCTMCEIARWRGIRDLLGPG